MNDEKWTEEEIIEYLSHYEFIYKFSKKYKGYTVYQPCAPNRIFGPARYCIFKDGEFGVVCDDFRTEQLFKKLDKIYEKESDYELIDLRDRPFGRNKTAESDD